MRAKLIRTASAAIMIALIASFAGCAPAPDVFADEGEMINAAFNPLGQNCADLDGAPPDGVKLSRNTVLVSATRCIYVSQITPGDGVWLMRVEQRATEGLEDLADALRLPSLENPKGVPVPCGHIGQNGPVVLSVTDTAGRETYPLLPTQACGIPRLATMNTIAALPWQVVSTTKIQQEKTEAELNSLCAKHGQPAIALTAAGYGSTSVVNGALPIEHLVCRYEIDPGNEITAPDGTTLFLGSPVGVSVMDAASVNELFSAVGSDPPDGCIERQPPFAVLFAVDATVPTITIELGGSFRILWGGMDELNQIDGAVVQRLFG